MTHGKRILLIEDEPADVLALETILTGRGFSVRKAADGVAGWAELQRSTPDLVILDLMLPKLPGLDILTLAKRTESTKHVPIIVLSNIDDEEVIERARTLGARDHLVKGRVRAEEVVEKVVRLLR